MRTLSRPMFRMGGPIKEGVMHGIREPYRGGQLVQPGPGRPGYAGEGYFKNIYGAALPIAKSFLNPIKKAKKYIKAGQKLFGKTPPKSGSQLTLPGMGGSGVTGSTAGSAWTAGPAKYLSKLKGIGPVAKNLWNQHRYKTLIGGGMGAPYIIEGAKNLPWDKIGGAVTHPIKQWGKVFGIGDDEKITNTDTDTTDKTNLPSVKKVLTDAEKKLIEDIKLKNAKAAKDKRVNDLLEIMNYDKSRKNAAYDALIDASEVIRETGFKDKSILPIVKATSARFDKPEQIKEAVGLMMAKGEIEKDIYKSKDTQSEQRIKSIMEGLGVDRETATAIDYKQPNNIAQALLVGISTRGRGTIPTSDTTYSDLYSFLETRNRLDKLKGTYNEDDIKDIGGIGKNKTFKTHADVVKDKPDGLYVVEEKVVEVKTGRNPKARVVGG